MANLERITPHEPYQLDTPWKLEKIKKTVIDAIEDGLPVREAFILAGVDSSTYYRWCREFVEDLEDGFTGTALMDLMSSVAKADAGVFRSFSKKMMQKAEEGDTRIMIYLADNRFGYANKRKNTLEVGSNEDSNIEINIVNMTGVDTDTNTEIEEIEVNGVSRDDSDTTEMD